MMIPTTAASLTPDWFETILGLQANDITQVDIKSSEGEAGLASLMCFVELEYKPGVDAPLSLVVKLAPTFEATLEMAKNFRLFTREAQFYQDIASKISMRTPKSYHADSDPDSGAGVLVLENCAHLTVIDQFLLQPTSLEDLKLIVDAAAQLAISSMNADWLIEQSELLTPQSELSKAFFGGLQAGFPAIIESHFYQFAAKEFRPVVDRLATDFAQICANQPQTNISLCHLDFRLNNMFLDQHSENPVVVFDWCSIYLGRTAQDLGYLLSTGYSAEFRRTHEESLVRQYQQTLQHAGIKNYSFDDAWLDYRHGIVIGARLLPMFSNNDLNADSEGGTALAEKVYREIPIAILDHGGVDLIDELLVKR